MRSALLLHGKPTRERYENPEIPKPHEANWLPWLDQELGKRGIIAARPAFPEPYYPQYERWKELFERYGHDADMAIVGHSAGAEFALRWLSENKDVSIRQLVLVAPWTDTKGKYGDFSQYELDTSLGKRIGRIAIFNSVNDEPVQDRVAELREALPEAAYVEFQVHGHFMLGNTMSTNRFPQLRNELLRPSNHLR